MSGRRDPVVQDPWTALRRFTPARLAPGRAGPALPTAEVLRLGLDHARARDAVHAALDAAALSGELSALGHAPLIVHSAASDRTTYLARPDLGRRLDDAGAAALRARPGPAPELAVVCADGLSALAVQRHAAGLLRALRDLAPQRWSRLPVVVALQARVALGDEAGERLGARLAAVLIGERPGLSAPDSLGVYLTYGPRRGRTDAERNCISNVRPEGLSYAEAAWKVDWLVREALSRGLTGVGLKDGSGPLPAPPLPGQGTIA